MGKHLGNCQAEDILRGVARLEALPPRHGPKHPKEIRRLSGITQPTRKLPMADTTYLKSKVEEYVRAWLAQKFGKPFRSEFLPLSRVKDRPAKHGFDAVSEGRTIVCGIKTASWTTSGGKRGAGKIQ